ncbi:hypothetical protein R69919_01738 [Paraburkholderia gardini]|uniref:Uncharacterized protein n=1 Tax=Paraburkholderia gardini TaxID=2823469 RepID=A0ABM8U4T9_9BURK|nr:hypothetical protein R69919_01738 [Paraburkholderia gardini]CAG4903150.1 hypothetical protein R54767_02929 [Paraburkholderia gardini]
MKREGMADIAQPVSLAGRTRRQAYFLNAWHRQAPHCLLNTLGQRQTERTSHGYC